jgi:hypothetical protein
MRWQFRAWFPFLLVFYMLKFLLSLGILVGLNAPSWGQQIRYGLKAGVSLARFTTSYNASGARNLVGAAAGVITDAALSEKLSLHPELLYSQKGQRFEGRGPGGFRSSDKFRFHYLDLPVLLRLKFSGFFAEAGPQAGYLLSARNTHTQSDNTMPPLTYSSNTTSSTRRFDVGYVVGVGYQLRERWELGARYNGGILGINPGSSGGNQPRNSVFQFQAGYLFGGN